jgi:hypothetical protein
MTNEVEFFPLEIIPGGPTRFKLRIPDEQGGQNEYTFTLNWLHYLLLGEDLSGGSPLAVSPKMATRLAQSLATHVSSQSKNGE